MKVTFSPFLAVTASTMLWVPKCLAGMRGMSYGARGNFVCYLDSVQMSSDNDGGQVDEEEVFNEDIAASMMDVKLGILQLGLGTTNLDGQTLFDEGWTLDAANNKLTVDKDLNLPYWCIDVAGGGSYSTMRYNLEFVVGPKKESSDGIVVEGANTIFMASEETTVVSTTSGNNSFVKEIASAGGPDAALLIKCEWSAELLCADQGFIYDYRGLDDLGVCEINADQDFWGAMMASGGDGEEEKSPCEELEDVEYDDDEDYDFDDEEEDYSYEEDEEEDEEGGRVRALQDDQGIVKCGMLKGDQKKKCRKRNECQKKFTGKKLNNCLKRIDNPKPQVDYTGYTESECRATFQGKKRQRNECLRVAKPDAPIEPEVRIIEEIVPDISTAEVTKVMDWIQAELTQDLIGFCWRDSYGRGVGKIPTECPGRDKIGALCYSKCPTGMKRFGFDCHSVCPSDMRDDGLFCRKAEYGRGAGYPWKFGDPLNDSGMYKRCEKDHGKGGCEKWGLVVYPKCRSGYSPFGCCICRPSKPNCGALGLNNGIDLSCAKRIQIGDPIPMSCRSDLEYDAGLCYPRCKDKFNGIGPVCWQYCDSDQTDCGAGCAGSGGDCGLAILDQITAPLILAANIATFGLAAPATGAADAAVDTIVVGGKVVLGTSKFGKAFVKAIKALQTIKPGAADGAFVVQIIKHAKFGTKLRTVNTGRKVSSLAYGAVNDLRQAFADEFADHTSRAINDKIDDRFIPETARFLKMAWADVQVARMSETWGWQIAEAALTAVSIVDISGVTGVIAAYSKPVCAAVIDFPCLRDADLTNCSSRRLEEL